MTKISGYQPVAGCAPIGNADAQPYHRCWAVVDASNNVLDPVQCPALGQVNAGLSFGYLVLKAAGMLRLDVPLDVVEDDESVLLEVNLNGNGVKVVDEGDLAAAWFSNYLGQKCRLVKVHPDFPVPASWW